jgi:hypothetical protein
MIPSFTCLWCAPTMVKYDILAHLLVMEMNTPPIYTLSLNLRKQKLLHLIGRIISAVFLNILLTASYAEHSPASSTTGAQPLNRVRRFNCVWSVVTAFATASHQTLSHNIAHHPPISSLLTSFLMIIPFTCEWGWLHFAVHFPSPSSVLFVPSSYLFIRSC